MRIEDTSGIFSSQEHEDLLDFVRNELLSCPFDTSILDVIKIRDDGPVYQGYWKAAIHYEPTDSTKIVALAAVIVLNSHYLKALQSLKRTLAHEYGHHWTLSYLAINHSFDMSQQLPQDYYTLRQLSRSGFSSDYSKGWEKCDREIIAEDYRFFFAPDPHNQAHKLVNSFTGIVSPQDTVREYIQSLAFFFD